MKPLALTFTGEQEAACARSACKRLLAAPAVHLTKQQRATVTDLLTDLQTVGTATGLWSIAREPERMRALHFALSRQQRFLTASGEPDRAGSGLAAFNRLLREIAEFDAWPLANGEVVTFVRLGFGDSHGIAMRSLNFEVDIPNRLTLEAALTDGMASYNRMNGADAAAQLGPLWDEMGTVTLGRHTDPIMRVRIPHIYQQRNGGDNASSSPLPSEEVTNLVSRIMQAAKACAATPLVRSHEGSSFWDHRPPRPPARPAEMTLIWQD